MMALVPATEEPAASGVTASAAGPAPQLSVIIPHLNTPDLLARCLDSLLAQSLPAGRFEVIVVDNGSRVPLDAVMERFPTVRFMLEPRPGPGLARNLGVAASGSACLAFIDADCIAGPGWIAAAHAAAAAGSIAGGRIRIAVANPAHMSGAEAFECVFGFRQAEYIARKHFSVTANLAMPRAAFEEVGPFGDIHIAEDLDWGRRAHRAGKALTYLPDMLVFHPPRPDLPALKRKFDRLLEHDWREHVQSGRRGWRWWARAAAMALSPLLDWGRIALSPEVEGLGNRWRGIATLFAIRWYRARRMATIAAAPPSAGAMMWNR
ncbi:glycosyltransferase family 2 protein [Sandarakinorhabdus rubra]|uniref:glycosyltransferase family 2 protein n=1 Tax=Sandarakinorhabdus rubra TaxID=2672568 RepID=UPI0013DAC783|nr:glycosyltransferase [Sandarakinorhabdus rubra]